MVFDDVRHSLHAVAFGEEVDAPFDADAPRGVALPGIDAFMFDAAARGVDVVRPQAFDVDESALSRAIDVVLEEEMGRPSSMGKGIRQRQAEDCRCRKDGVSSRFLRR